MEGEQEEFKVHYWCGYSTERGKSWVWRNFHTRKWFTEWYAATSECCIWWSVEFPLSTVSTVSSCLHKYWPLKWWWITSYSHVNTEIAVGNQQLERRESPESGSQDNYAATQECCICCCAKLVNCSLIHYFGMKLISFIFNILTVGRTPVRRNMIPSKWFNLGIYTFDLQHLQDLKEYKVYMVLYQ